jgi:hypothetical protein
VTSQNCLSDVAVVEPGAMPYGMDDEVCECIAQVITAALLRLERIVYSLALASQVSVTAALVTLIS